jgi:hypothetical protein
VELISYSTIFMKYWAGLHSEKDADDLQAGADGLFRLASATNFGVDPSQDVPCQVQRPLRIRDANLETDAVDVDLEDQD